MRFPNQPAPKLTEAEQLEMAGNANPYDERARGLGDLERHYANQRLETGVEPAQRKAERLLAGQAASYAMSEVYERYLRWKEADDPRFDDLDPQTRIALGDYQEAKAAAKEVKARG